MWNSVLQNSFQLSAPALALRNRAKRASSHVCRDGNHCPPDSIGIASRKLGSAQACETREGWGSQANDARFAPQHKSMAIGQFGQPD